MKTTIICLLLACSALFAVAQEDAARQLPEVDESNPWGRGYGGKGKGGKGMGGKSGYGGKGKGRGRGGWRSSTYYADLGEYGTFYLTISADDSRMRWTSHLRNIDQLEEIVQMGQIKELNYHLHQQWTNPDADYGVGGTECGPPVTGGHYDPYFACGPASGQSTEPCAALGRPRDPMDGPSIYACTPENYEAGMYDQCEVGDLSGKAGPISINRGGQGNEFVRGDPLPALDTHFVDDTTENDADKFASIVFHLGSPRVLCGRLFLKEHKYW